LAGYALAVDVASRLWLIPNVVGRAYFARLANLLATEHPGDHRRELENYAVITTGAVVTAAIPLSVMAAPLLRAWTGSASLGSAGSTLTWLTWGIVASVVSHAPFTTLQLRLHTRVLFFANLVFLVVHAGAATVLVRVMGPQGAAASWTVGQAAITLALHFAMFRLYGVALTNVMVRAALAIAAGLLGALILTSLRQVPAGPATGSLVSRLAPLVPHAAGLAAITGTTLAALVFSHRRRAVER
jgi:O-antigen/teichoic acid export membrane protein